MKKNIAIIVLALLVGLLVYAAFFHSRSVGRLTASMPPDMDLFPPHLVVGFDYGRQTGMGSNQFAVWIEDAEGRLVKTLVATDFTAGRGGWSYRKDSLPLWVAASGIAKMTKEQVDAVSGATPPYSQRCWYIWYGDDAEGNAVPAGVYTVMIEATLRGKNQVLYQAEIDISGDEVSVMPAPIFSGESTAERGMITNVVVNWSIGQLARRGRESNN